MKILSKPVLNQLICSCGCKFEFDSNDIKVHTKDRFDETDWSYNYVECPVCGNIHTIIKDLSENETQLFLYTCCWGHCDDREVVIIAAHNEDEAMHYCEVQNEVAYSDDFKFKRSALKIIKGASYIGEAGIIYDF